MIRYTLRCERGHEFESWFQNSSAYEKQVKRKLVNCPACGSAKVEKAIMAPRIVGKKPRARGADAGGRLRRPPMSRRPHRPAYDGAGARAARQTQGIARSYREERRQCRRTFPNEARKMHYGDIEHRPIYGEASPDEARALIDEGVEVIPLPVLPEDRN